MSYKNIFLHDPDLHLFEMPDPDPQDRFCVLSAGLGGLCLLYSIMHATPFSTSNPPVSSLVYPCSGNVVLVQNIPQVLKGQFHETHSVKQSRSRWIRYYFLVSAGP